MSSETQREKGAREREKERSSVYTNYYLIANIHTYIYIYSHIYVLYIYLCVYIYILEKAYLTKKKSMIELYTESIHNIL